MVVALPGLNETDLQTLSSLIAATLGIPASQVTMSAPGNSARRQMIAKAPPVLLVPSSSATRLVPTVISTVLITYFWIDQFFCTC
jgi:hypothetical protein